MSERGQVIEDCKRELATNFEVSALRILAYYGAKLGVGANRMRAILTDSARMPFGIMRFAEQGGAA